MSEVGYVDLEAAEPTHTATPIGPSPTPTPVAYSCFGDSDGDGTVTIAELIRAENIALGNAQITGCFSADVDRDASATINELIAAVNIALNGCVPETAVPSTSSGTRRPWRRAIRMLFDWLVTGQVIAHNPAHAVRGPRHVVRHRKTPVRSVEGTRQLLVNIGTGNVVGLRECCERAGQGSQASWPTRSFE